MFTDEPVTPRRLEVVLDTVLHVARRAPVRREVLYAILQPAVLPDVNGNVQAQVTIRAAIELQLLEQDGQSLSPSDILRSRGRASTRDVVLGRIDELVLADVGVEPYFAPFYSYLLGLNARGSVARDGQDWATDFIRDVHRGVLPPNPFNKSKFRGLERWWPYAGLGWFDPAGGFQCDPFPRIDRAIPTIFGTHKRLDASEFMVRLAKACPELDGGSLFLSSNPEWSETGRECTLGLSHALVELHEAERVVLHCPRDSHGWSLALAEPPRDDRHLRSDRFDFIELCTG